MGIAAEMPSKAKGRTRNESMGGVLAIAIMPRRIEEARRGG